VAHHAPGTKTVADLVKFPSFEDPREPETRTPRWNLLRKSCSAEILAKVPSKLRWYYRLQQHSRSWSRRGTIIQHSRCSRCWCASRGRCRDCLPLLRNPACSMWRRLAWQRARRTAPVFLACAPEVAVVKLSPTCCTTTRPAGREVPPRGAAERHPAVTSHYPSNARTSSRAERSRGLVGVCHGRV
jgi:hypothetical protein